jgi:hypothetical protein
MSCDTILLMETRYPFRGGNALELFILSYSAKEMQSNYWRIQD